MSVCLVTGGAGFIGSHVVDALVSRGDSVRIVDDLSTGSSTNVRTSSKVEFVQADLAEPGVASIAVDGVEWVVHLAAIPSVPRSVRDPARTHRANVEGKPYYSRPAMRTFVEWYKQVLRRFMENLRRFQNMRECSRHRFLRTHYIN